MQYNDRYNPTGQNDRATIKEHARNRLRAYWGPCIGVYALCAIFTTLASVALLGIGALFVVPPLTVGVYMFFLRAWRGEAPLIETMFAGFNQYGRSLVGMLWMGLWTFLWSLLFVIPGIVKAIAYSATPYLIADHQDIDPRHALKVSMEITRGHRMEIFVMGLSFIGWELLCGFTLGILELVYVGPYRSLAFAGLYEELLRDALEEGRITARDLGATGALPGVE